ncbi:hypothetical protein DH2020_029246 [Rehmannia glutinosa]|uniref:Plant basic secretory protein n=1 Tax=Rehmannia glutinosa TaxID=99300 RepID=A0ABR0VRR8_REHGL
MANLVLLITLSSLALILSAIEGISAVEYTVINTAENTPGGARFDADIGGQYSQETLENATTFIWGIFQQNNESDRKNVERVSLFIDDMDGFSYVSINDQIHVSARYIQVYPGDVKREITGILYHQMTHIWQWIGNGQPVPDGLIEGIADFVRLKSGYAPTSHWVSAGQGDRWDQGYDVTARFLDYCDQLKNGTFVAELNQKMRDGYNDGYFQELLGKSVDDLWVDYKAKFNN